MEEEPEVYGLKRSQFERSEPKELSTSAFRNGLLESDQKESALLRTKLETMASSLGSLKVENSRLRQEREKLLEINSMYLSNFEKIYESRAEINSPRGALSASKGSQSGKGTSRLEANKKSCCSLAGAITSGMDYKGLVRYCQVLQKQANTHKQLSGNITRMTQALSSTKHQSIQSLVDQAKQICKENHVLRSSLNKAELECQSTRRLYEQAQSYIRQLETQQRQHLLSISELQSKINKLTQQNIELQKRNDKQVYSLDVKCNQLERELRKNQMTAAKSDQLLHLNRISQLERPSRIMQQGRSASFSNVQHSLTKEKVKHQSQLSRDLYYVGGPTQLRPTKKSACRITVHKHLSLDS